MDGLKHIFDLHEMLCNEYINGKRDCSDCPVYDKCDPALYMKAKEELRACGHEVD